MPRCYLLACCILMGVGTVLIGIQPSVKQTAGYFCIYLAGVLCAGPGSNNAPKEAEDNV